MAMGSRCGVGSLVVFVVRGMKNGFSQIFFPPSITQSFFALALSHRPRPRPSNGTRGQRDEDTASSWEHSLLFHSLSLSLFLSFSVPFGREKAGGTRKEKKKKTPKRRGKTMTTAGNERRSPPPPAPSSPPPPFRFGARRDRIDWGALHGVDVERMVCCLLCGLKKSLFSSPLSKPRPPPLFFLLTPARFFFSPSLFLLLVLPFFFPRLLPQAATTDALEKCVSSVAYGDLDAEPRGKLSEVKREE